MSGSSSPEVMEARAKELVDKNDVEYVNTNGNTLYFQGKGHKANDTTVYIITAEIQLNGEIEWSCSCVYNEYHDDCKHTIACGSNNDSWSLLIKKELTIKYNDRIDVLSADKDNDDDGRDDRHMQDDEVVGKVAYKIESDDD